MSCEHHQGKRAYLDRVPDYTITDLRDLLAILGMQRGVPRSARTVCGQNT